MQRTDPAPNFPAPDDFRSALAPIATSADALARLFSGKDVSDDVVEGSAETVSQFLRQLARVPDPDAEDIARAADIAASTPCPAWCVVKHDDIHEEYVRECASAADELDSLTHQSISATAIRLTDLDTGAVRAPEIRINDDRVSPENALRLVEQIRAAVAVVMSPTVPAVLPCPVWCQRDHAERAELEQDTQSREHSLDLLSIRRGNGREIAAVSVLAVDDLATGQRTPAEVWLEGGNSLNGTDAVQLADAVQRAVAIVAADQGPEAPVGQTRPGCAPWCTDARQGTNCGDECMAEPVDVPATGGYVQHRDRGGIILPVAETYAHITESGAPAVHVRVSGPTDLDTERDAWADLTPAEARRYAAAILAQADLAEQVQR